MNPENSQLENQERQEEDVTRRTSLCEQMLRIGYETASDLSRDSNDDSERIQQDVDVSRTNFQQRLQQPLDAVDKKLVELLGLADDEKVLTEDRLKKLNEHLESGSLDKQETVDFLIRRGICINYQDPKTKQSAIDIAWENEYYYSMLVLLEADSKFPQDFNLHSFYQGNEFPRKLKAFVSSRQNLHKWIQGNELKQVRTLVNNRLSKFLNNENKSALEIAAATADVNILARLINIQLPLREITLTKAQRDLLKQVDEEGNTLLSIASKSGKNDNVDFFIRCGIDINHRNKLEKSAVDLAWENKHYNIVLTLLKADSDFPDSFDLIVLNKGNAQKELKKFIVKRNSLHEKIEKKQLENNKDYTDACNESKFYLNSESQSAMFTAIKYKRFDNYVILKFAGFMFKNKDEEECINKLSDGEKDKLKMAMNCKFSPIDEEHIFHLISKSRANVRPDKDRFEKLYRSLNNIPEVSIILKVIHYIDYLDILFDFDNSNIKDMCPTASKATKGTTDFKEGRIYIAANVEENKLLGTLAQELTHLAMYILYKNDCKPFDKLDDNRRQTFESITADIENYTKDIVKKIDNNVEDNSLITLARAFTYRQDEQQSELIVRIPHILAQYGDEGRKCLLNTSKEIKSLFDFYTDQAKGGMAYRCIEFIESSYLIKPRNDIKGLNETCGEINEMNNIITQGINFKDSIDIDNFLTSSKQVFLIKTGNTLFSILSIYESLIIKNKNYSTQDTLFFKLDCYIEKQHEINRLFYSAAGKVLCIRYACDKNKKRLSNALKILNILLEQKSDKKVVFIILESKTEEFNEIKSVFNHNCYKEETEHKFTLNDLTEESQQILLERKIIFQEEKISLNILIDKSDKNGKGIIDAEMLEELITNKIIKIGSRPLGTIDLEGAYSELIEEVNMEVLVDKLLPEETNDVYIISGIPKVDAEKKLIEYLVTADINNREKLKDSNLESRIAVINQDKNNQEKFKDSNLDSRIAVINQDKTRAINNRILVADDQFKKEDFKQICQNNRERKVYWINVEHENCIPKFTLQQIYNPDFYIKADRFEHTKCLIGEDALIAEIKDKKVVIIAGDPGMGKTNALVKLYELQYTLPSGEEESLIKSRWVITVNLKDHLNAIRDIDFTIPTEIVRRITDFVSQFDTNVKNNFAKKLLGMALVNQNFRKPVLIVFDGFDELLDEEDRQKVILLLKTLKEKTKAQFWITTRFYYQQILEDKLSTFAIKINPTGDKSTKEFVKKYFKNRLSLILSHEKFQSIIGNDDDTIKNTKMEAYINAFLSRMRKVFEGDVSKLIGTPLQLYLMLEGSIKYFKEWTRDGKRRMLNFNYLGYDMRNVYENFIDRKYDIYFKKGKVKEQLRQEQDKITFDHYHKALTKSFIFKSALKQSLTQITDIVLLAGIIRSDGSNIEFIHPTFRDYFAAKMFLNWIEKWKPRNRYKLTNTRKGEYLLTEILVKPDYKVIRTFLNSKVLRGKIANIDLQEEDAKRILREATKERNTEIIRFVLDNVDNSSSIVNDKYNKGQTLLQMTAQWGDLRMVKYLVNRRKAVYNHTVLHMAVSYGKVQVVTFLKNLKGVDLNAKDKDGNTLLFKTVHSDNLTMVKYLIRQGVNVNLKNKFGETILFAAAKFGNLDMVKFLINDNKIDFTGKNNNDRTIFHEAACSGNLDTVKFLINVKKADFNATDKNGTTSLQMAVSSGNLELVKFLVNEVKVDFNAKDNDGNTALQIARKFSYHHIVDFLENREAVLP
ncbi:uncharacterized protein LOC144467950 [Augochlora pura]